MTQVPFVCIASPTGVPVTVSDAGVMSTAGASATAAGGASSIWNAAAVGAGGISNAQAVSHMKAWTIMGNTSGASTITLLVADAAGVPFYTTAITVAANGDFHLDCRGALGATYVKLKSSAAVTITAGAVGSY